MCNIKTSRGTIMARNFKMFVNRTSETLQVGLEGDFDSRSALKLLNLLKSDSLETGDVIIDTNSLEKIFPFAVDAFHRNLHLLTNNNKNFSFTGENANVINPGNRHSR